MKSQKTMSRFQLLGSLIILLATLAPARAQSGNSDQKPAVKQATKAEGEAGEVKALQSKVEQLQLLVEQQQRTLAGMQKRLDELAGARPTAVVSTRPDGTQVTSSDLRTASLETNQQKGDWPVISTSKSKAISPTRRARCCAIFMSTCIASTSCSCASGNSKSRSARKNCARTSIKISSSARWSTISRQAAAPA